MDENLIALAKRLKAIRKALKQTAGISHQLEFIEDINNQLKEISSQLKAVFEEIDATIVENQELLAAARQGVQRAAASGEALASILLSCDKLAIHAAMRLDHVRSDISTARYTKQALPVYTSSEPAVGEEGVGASGNVYLDIADRYFILDNKSVERFQFITPSGENVILSHENIEGLAKALQERIDKLEDPSEKKSPEVEQVLKETARLKNIAERLKLLIKPSNVLEKYLPALFSKDAPLDKLKQHAAYVIDISIEKNYSPTGIGTEQTIPLHRVMEITDSYDGEEGTRLSDFDRIKIITANYQVQMQRYPRDEVEWSHAVNVYHKAGGGPVEFTEESCTEFLRELIERTELLILPELVIDEVKKNQYYWMSSVLKGLFIEGDFKKIIEHVKYVTAVQEGLIARKEIDSVDKKELILISSPFDGNYWCEGIGSDGVIHLRTRNYTLVLKPNLETNPKYPYIFEIKAARLFAIDKGLAAHVGDYFDNDEWIPVIFKNDQDVEHFTSELTETVNKLA